MNMTSAVNSPTLLAVIRTEIRPI